MNTGIYQIRNLVNGKLYIGSAAGRGGLKGRWRSHHNAAQAGKHRNPHLQSAWNKYTESSFVFEVLEYCEPLQCIEREQHYLDTVLFASCNDRQFEQLGYNICRVAGSNLGLRWSDEVKARMGAPKIGKKHSQKTKDKIGRASKGNTYRLGAITSNETKAKLRKIRLGQKMSEESKMRLSIAKRGENAILTVDDILKIRILLTQGVAQQVIASQFDVHPTTISNIKTGKRWGYV